MGVYEDCHNDCHIMRDEYKVLEKYRPKLAKAVSKVTGKVSYYLAYRLYDHALGQWVRKQKRIPSEYCKDEKTRQRWIRVASRIIEDAQDEGRLLVDKQRGSMTVEEVLDRGLAIKNQSVTTSTVDRHKSIVRLFKAWLKNERLLLIECSQLNHAHVTRYFNVITSKYASNTLTTHKLNLSGIWGAARGEAVVDYGNPFERVKLKKTNRTTRITVFSPDEQSVLLAGAKSHSLGMWLMIHLIMYGFIRTSEACRIKGRNLKKDTILIDPADSKNKKGRVVKIVGKLRTALDEYGAWGIDDEQYLVGKYYRPNDLPNHAPQVRKVFLKIRRNAGVHGTGKTLYSFKHTGVTQAYEAGNSLRWIQRQCGHYTERQTLSYLSELGISFDDDYVDW